MQPWFIWKGRDSLSNGLWVSELPAPTRAAESIRQVEIPGRAGTLTIREGEDVHRGYRKDITVTARSDADFQALTDWLSGDGVLIVSNEPDKAYIAHLANEVKFTRISNTLKTCTLPFFVQPHKMQNPPESNLTFSTDGTIYNPGNVASHPRIAVTFTGEAAFTLGDATMTLTSDAGEEETVYIDCDAEIITDGEDLWEGEYTGTFPRIAPGTNSISLTDCTVVITPRWRWR